MIAFWKVFIIFDEYTKKMTKESFLKNRQVQDAVIRNFIVMGEAVKALSPTFRDQYPKVRWASINGMRNFIVHDYLDINLQVVWSTVKDNLPLLKKQIVAIVKELKK